MSLSRGSCRICCLKVQQDQRSRRRRNDDPTQQKRSWQHKMLSSPQPTILLIQSNDDAIQKDVDSTNTNPSIVLCKCLPYSVEEIGNEEIATRRLANSDDVILAFDNSVRIFLKETVVENNSDNIRSNKAIEEMIQSYCDEDKTDYSDDDSIHREWWSLVEADPYIVRRVCCYCPSDDRRRRHRPNSHRHVNINARITANKVDSYQIEKNSMTSVGHDENRLKTPSRRRRRVAIPLFPPSVTIRPLQSLIITIVLGSIPLVSVNSYQYSLLLHSCWKRQLVGKVIAMDDQWSCRIRLYTNDDDDESGDIVFATTESFKVLTMPTSPLSLASLHSHRYKEGKDRPGSLSLPKDFYAVLPSTKITIRQYPQRSIPSLPPDRPVSNSLPVICTASNFNINRKSLRPPSAAAGLLVDTIDCVRFGSGDVPRSFLLSGPPGVGKTFSATWAASVYPDDTLLCSIRGSELLQVTGGNDQSDNCNTPAHALEWEFQKMVNMISLREQRNDTAKLKSTMQPPSSSPLDKRNQDSVVGLIFLDECDALVSVDSVAAMLADLLDRVSSSSSLSKNVQNGKKNDLKRYWKNIVVVGATNRIDSIPTYLRRAGRFDREISIFPPTAKERAIFITSLLTMVQKSNPDDTDNILPQMSELTTQTKATGSSAVEDQNDMFMCKKDPEIGILLKEEIKEIAELCVGYVAADLSALVRKAWLLSLEEKGDDKIIMYSHLEEARHIVGASALRDASLAAPPKISWDDISGDPGGAKTALRQAIEWPRLKAREFALLGLQPCRGILLYGPPGCAKTTLARAAAGSSGVAFLSFSPAEVYASSYVGEAERVIRQAFNLARSTAPCILFFDEIDSIFGGGGDSGRGNSAEARVLSTFLNEMDGVDIAGAGKDGVLVLGATNRPWTLDSALLRPGRLGDKIIFLPPPDKEARRSILKRQLGNVAGVSDEIDLSWDILIDLTEGMTGAEIIGGCQDAKLRWMRETFLNTPSCKPNLLFQHDYIVDALMSVNPLLSNPQVLEEFQVFGNYDTKSSFVSSVPK
mmetsp:Transcript_6536/g.7561  ORF Transcript_6536/g.7561 Transcript_6536/m.7561 type:complete len:1038 (+) Transcript_6536:93-3206(+)